MKIKLLVILLFLLSGIFMLQHNIQAQYQYGPWVTGSGGGTVSGDSYTVVSILGQSLSGVKQYDNLLMRSGFMYTGNLATITGIEQPGDYIPQQFGLGQNYPNPFYQITAIEYELPEKSHVSIIVYNAYGQAIAMLVSEYRESGRYKVSFDPVNLPGGVYFYRMKAGVFTDIKKMLLLR
jgi:hypothetical protein